MKLRFKLLLGLCLAMLVLAPLAAQDTNSENKFATPKSTVRYFLKIMNKVDYEKAPRIDEAVEALYLNDVPEANRLIVGREMAEKLFRVLYYYTFKVDALPEATTQNSYTLPIGGDKGMDITLRRYADGQWKFNYTKTLCHLDEYVETINKEQNNIVVDNSIDSTFRSPRETLRYFFSNMSRETKEGTENAAEALDLSSFERSIRKDIGFERSMLLNSILARSRYIDLVEIPDDSKSAPVVILRDSVGRITLEKVKIEDSDLHAWKFSSASVKALPLLYDAYRDKEVLSDINSVAKLPLSIRVRDYMKKNFPTLMETTFILENWQWIGLFCVVFMGLAFSKIVLYIIRNSIRVVFEKAKVDLDLEAHHRFMIPIGIALTGAFWWAGVYILSFSGNARVILLVGVKILTAISAVWAGYRLVDVAGNYLTGKALQTTNKFDDLLAPLITKALKVMVVICGLVFIADIFAIDIDKFMAGLGIGGIGFAFAAKDSISNIFGSLTVLLDRPFQIGDWVTIGNADGTVESVGIRSTRIRTFYDSLITIPNSELITAQIDNYGARTYRRINTSVGITYNTPPEKIEAFCEGIRELIRNHPSTRKDYFIVSFNKFSASSLDIMVYCFLKCPDWVAEEKAKHKLFCDILRLGAKLGVEFAFPTQVVYTRQDQTPSPEPFPQPLDEAKAKGRAAVQEILKEERIS